MKETFIHFVYQEKRRHTDTKQQQNDEKLPQRDEKQL